MTMTIKRQISNYLSSTYQFQDVCLWRRSALCLSGSCSPCKGCAGVYGHHGTSWPDQSQWCTPSCPSFQGPLRSCQAWHLDGWNSWSGCTQYDWSKEGKWRNCQGTQRRQGDRPEEINSIVDTFNDPLMVMCEGKILHSTYTSRPVSSYSWWVYMARVTKVRLMHSRSKDQHILNIDRSLRMNN